jgi:hypothetical protein
LGPLFGPEEEPPVKAWFWNRLRFDGFWTFKKWVIDPILSWTLIPAFNFAYEQGTKFLNAVPPVMNAT